MPTTTRRALPYPALTSAADVPADIAALANALDGDARIDQGALSGRPAFGSLGRFYWATDTSLLYYDTGSAWITIGPAQGIAADSITATHIAPSAVGSSELADLAVDTAAIQDSAVTAAKILDGTVGTAEMSTALKPSAGAAGSTEALRALGTAAGTAAAGTHGSQHHPQTGADRMVMALSGLLAARPAATAVVAGTQYFATDDSGGTLYQSDGANWAKVAASASVTGGGAPSGAAGGGLTGTYPNPTLAANSVSASQITDGQVGSAELASGAVISGKIGAGAVAAAEIADGTVGSAELGSSSVTDAKVAASGISLSKIIQAGCRATTAGINIIAQNWVTINWATNTFSRNMAISGNGQDIAFPYAGLYLIVLHVRWAVGAWTHSRLLAIQANSGGGFADYEYHIMTYGTNAEYQWHQTMVSSYYNPGGHLIRFNAFQNEAGTTAIDTGIVTCVQAVG